MLTGVCIIIGSIIIAASIWFSRAPRSVIRPTCNYWQRVESDGQSVEIGAATWDEFCALRSDDCDRESVGV